MVSKKKYNRIKEVLVQKDRTQMWLSDQIERSRVVTSNYCNNNKQPSIQTLFRIADALDVDVRELLVSDKQEIN